MASGSSSTKGFLDDPYRQSSVQSHSPVSYNGVEGERRSGGGGEGTDAQNEGNASWVPRPKRIACVVCRKRKLRCDGKKPSCGTCSRLGHDCAYDEVRKKSGPKRGYVKQLEARLGTNDLHRLWTPYLERPDSVTDACYSVVLQPRSRPSSRLKSQRKRRGVYRLFRTLPSRPRCRAEPWITCLT